MQSIDTAQARAIAKDIDAALKAVATKYGIDFRPVRGSFTSTTLNYKIEGATRGETGDAMTLEAREYTRCAHLLDLNPNNLFATFYWDGDRYKLTGLKMNRPKFPICAVRLRDGKQFKLTASLLKGAVFEAALKKEAA